MFTSALSLAYLPTVLVVSFPCNVHATVLAPEEQKLSILLQNYGFTWVLLVFSTAVLRSAEIGSTYFITAWNACALLGCVVGLVEATARVHDSEAETEVENESAAYAGGGRYQAISTDEDANGQQSSPRIVEDPEPTETTPLVLREHLHPPPPPPSEGQGAIGWWILQLLLVVPLPVILVFHISVIVLGASNQTLTDGNSAASSKFTLSASFKVVLLITSLSPTFQRTAPCLSWLSCLFYPCLHSASTSIDGSRSSCSPSSSFRPCILGSHSRSHKKHRSKYTSPKL